MRITHVVALATPDNKYGGPLTVAINQANALADLGHEVIIFAGARGFEAAPKHLGNVRASLHRAVTLIPGTGFAGLSAPSMLPHLWREASRTDVAHVHLARDLITLPAARMLQWRGVPTYLQTHGMIDASDRRSASLLDAGATRRTLQQCAGIFYLTDRESTDLAKVERGLGPMVKLPNGVPISSAVRKHPNLVPEVLFMARLEERKRPLVFVEAAIILLKQGYSARFVIAGPDEGQGDAVNSAIRASGFSGRIVREPAVRPSEVQGRLAASDIYVLPSINEPYPMTVLESLAARVPTVITTSCGLATELKDVAGAFIAEEDTDAIVRAIASILDDPDNAAMVAASGQAHVTSRRSMRSVAERLVSAYQI